MEFERREVHSDTGVGNANCLKAGSNDTVTGPGSAVLVEPAPNRVNRFGQEVRFDVVWEVEVQPQLDTVASEETLRQHWCFEHLQLGVPV